MADHELRRNRIGGSDVAPIFGVDEFGRTAFDVWASKKGRLPPTEETTRLLKGKVLEPAILRLYELETGRKIEYHDRTLTHPTLRYMAATPDALCVGEKRGVDAKLAFWDQRGKWGEDENSIPWRCILQCIWYMAFFGYDFWDLFVLVGLEETRLYTIARDPELEQTVLSNMEAWHARYILGDEQPPLMHSDDAARWLQLAYPNHKRPDLRFANDDEIALLTSYVEVRLKQRELKACQNEMETALKAAIKDREGLRWNEGQFTWRKTKDGQTIDWESMAHWLMHQHVAEADRGQVIANYTHPKPGFRKIRIDHPALKKGAHEDEAAI